MGLLEWVDDDPHDRPVRRNKASPRTSGPNRRGVPRRNKLRRGAVGTSTRETKAHRKSTPSDDDDGDSDSYNSSTPMTPDVLRTFPVEPVSMGVYTLPMSTSPEPIVRATLNPNISRHVPVALPSPALTTSGTRQYPYYRQALKQNNVSSAGGISVGPSAPETEAQKKSASPSEWTIVEVVEWLKSKGFGSDICDKFIGQSDFGTVLCYLISRLAEQKITGDVLVELDINLLKEEIGIVAFGNRMRIVNAIAELRRSPLDVLHDHQPQLAQSITRSASPPFSRSRSPSVSTQHSFSSPMFASTESTLNRLPSPASVGAPESPQMETFMAPRCSRLVSSFATAGMSANGGSSIEGVSRARIKKPGPLGVASNGLLALPETQLSSSLGGSALAPPEVTPDENADENKGIHAEVSVVRCHHVSRPPDLEFA